MARRVLTRPNERGLAQGELDLAQYISSTSFDELVIDARPFDYATVQLVANTALTWGTTTITVQRSNDGVSPVAFGTPVSLTAVGMTAEQTIRAQGYLHVAVATAAGTGLVGVFVQFHKV